MRYASLFLLIFACQPSDDADSSDASVGAPTDTAYADMDVFGEHVDAPGDDTGVSAPDRVARFPDQLPFTVERVVEIGEGPDANEVEAFTRRMLEFYTGTDFIRWTRRISHGVADTNPWEEPSYLFWWQDVHGVKDGDVVTWVHDGGADNMMSHHGRVFGPMVGAWMMLGDTELEEPLRELVLGYIRGVSATFTASIWADEDPVVETIMARGIFHRNHSWTLDGGRAAAVDYEPVRHEVIERRHDTIHNADNPTWGDVWVRNKRSKDDLPWVYRMQVHLSWLLWATDDEEVREAAQVLYDQLQAFAQDVLDHGYIIRSKVAGGEVFIPYFEDSDIVDDFATMVAFEEWLPNAECNAKLPIALIATGESQGNDCGDGRSTQYEEVGLGRFYGHTWMQWSFHLGSMATAILYGENDAARELIEGFGLRADALHVRDDHISNDVRFDGDVAQQLVVAAAYGLPLTADEARLVMAQYEAAAEYYEPWPYWDPWSEAVPDGEFPYYPGLSHESAEREHIHIEEMANFFEYCASPVRAREGAQFIDCDVLTESSSWR